MSREQKILDILNQSITNFKESTKDLKEPLPDDVLEASCRDTIELVDAVDPLVANLMENFMDSHMTSTDDDFPFETDTLNYRAMEWLEYCKDSVTKCS